jgi:predicted Zn-dependent protease
LANLYRAQSPEKASAYIASLSPAQRRSIDDIERSLTNERLEKQAEALESQSNWAQAAEVQRRRLALDPDSVWITYRLSRDLVSAGEQAQADTLMRNMVSRKPGMPSGFMPGVSIYPAIIRTIWRWRSLLPCRAASGRITFVSWMRACKAIR